MVRIGRDRVPLRRVGADGYGPRKVNPKYAVEDSEGVTWRIERHKWVAPTTHWAWKAVSSKGRRFADTLEEMGAALGLGWKGTPSWWL